MNQQVDPARITWKVSIIGASGVGKSSLIARIVYDTPDYSGQFKSLARKVISFDYGGKKLKADILLQEIDPTTNSEKLLLGSNAIVVAIDITDEESFLLADDVLRYITTFEKSPLKLIAATKLDRKYEAKLWDNELEGISRKYSTKYFKTSSKTGEGVDDFLKALSAELSSRIKKKK